MVLHPVLNNKVLLILSAHGYGKNLVFLTIHTY